MSKEREAIQRVAADLRRSSNGRLTQTQAEARVRAAKVAGDRQRENNNR
mgnify:CR=1 FL=1